MRAWFLSIALSALSAESAAARQWNAYTPCDGLDPAVHDLQQYTMMGYCAPEQLTEHHRAFGALPLASIAQGERGVRVTIIEGRRYLDGVSHNVVMIDAVERRGRVSLTVRAVEEGSRRPRLRGELSEAAWTSIVHESIALADARGVDPYNDDPEVLIWIHPMEVVVETIGFGNPRTLQGDISRGGPAFDFAMRMTERALDAFPRCRGDADGDAWKLRDCVRLRSR